ncbi:MAG TPA: zinc ABC transporter substrate-binding protein [Pseudonocardiaceae bacterium]|jgi:zinc/manganese transport system substrate-binding protein|nr:zinc ABC transporter substrate-binding protein [Pseudonocardiaceae bacterium]
MIIRGPWPATAVLLAVLLGVVGCSPMDQAATAGGRLTVVASTDVWASVVRAVTRDAVAITTIIHDPAGDPHSYESTPADAAEVARADLVVFNGGGYDEFMTQLLAQAGAKPTVEAVTVAKAEPHAGEQAGGEPDTHPHQGGANEHVWYDLPVVHDVAERVAGELGKLAPAQAEQFTAGAERFSAGIDALQATVRTVAGQHAGAKVAMTEPVAFYLVEAARLDDVTPPEFVEAVEEETDPPAAAVAATRDLLTRRQVRVLIYNPQTETPVTSQVRSAAQDAGVPVVEMTETLPAGFDYLGWMSGQLDALSAALRR